MQPFNRLADTREMLCAVSEKFLLAAKAAGLNLWPEWINERSRARLPNIFRGSKFPVGPLQELQELTRCIKIAIPSSERTVVEIGGCGGRRQRMCCFRYVVIEPSLFQIARNMLRET